ncbi:MAG TPA: serine/threonine-protein kinase [Trebonia sp.]|nr:serine/threonine-protein kinase [Trebonia sp.]
MARVLAGRYELEVPLGRGASGEVWRGRDISTRKPVAVKLVELEEIEDSAMLAETIARFRREAATLARLRHPNIVAALEAGRIGNELFLVMELAEGVALSSMLEQRRANNLGLFPVPSVLRIIEQACAGLSVAHAAGVVHRDIKPSNLMVATRLHIKIIDFGIARLLHDNSPRLTLPSQAIGTLAYISPEQLGGVDVDGRADLYSLGCLMYELLAGRPPFMAEVPTALLRMQLQERATPLDSIRPDLPAGLSDLVDAMMEKDRAQRPADAGQVLRHIQAINAGMGQVTPEQEADRQTISRVTSLGGPATAGGPGQRPFAPEADRATVFAGDVLGHQQPPAEAGRGTQLTPERLEELSGPGGPGAYPAAGPGTAGGGPGYQGTRPDYGQPPTQHPGTSPAAQYPATQHPGTQEVSGPAWPDAVKARTRRRRSRWPGIVSTLITLAIVGGIGFYVWHRNQQQPLKVSGVSVVLASQPKNCASTVEMVATIVTNGKGGPVTYQWTENGSAQKAATVTDATGTDSVQVTLRWAFHGKGTQQAVAELQVLTPNSAVGNTQFTYSCK